MSFPEFLFWFVVIVSLVILATIGGRTVILSMISNRRRQITDIVRQESGLSAASRIVALMRDHPLDWETAENTIDHRPTGLVIWTGSQASFVRVHSFPGSLRHMNLDNEIFTTSEKNLIWKACLELKKTIGRTKMAASQRGLVSVLDAYEKASTEDANR